MEYALELAKKAALEDEVPVGAIITDIQGNIIGQGYNQIRRLSDPTAHAEIIAIKDATKFIKNERLTNCYLYVTLEPCTMCAGAIALARLSRVYFGASDEKTGALEHGTRFFHHPSCHHKIDVYGGIEETRSAALLHEFFANKR